MAPQTRREFLAAGLAVAACAAVPASGQSSDLATLTPRQAGDPISGNHFAESTVLALAHAYEQATDWHKRRPTLS